MEIEVIGSTKSRYVMPKEEAILFSGKSAGICYMPDTIETLFNESDEKSMKRAKNTLKSGHHSVFDHVTYNLSLNNIPKILAIILNNEGIYTTSEKSARYTKMQASPKEKELYEKWIEIYQKEIQKAINNLKKNYTILIIAHRLSTIINSDRILFIESGQVVAEGTHKQLLKNCLGYKELYEAELKDKV